jgi:hypothetical protein
VNGEHLLNVIKRLHEWRSKFNGDDIGLGYDSFKPHDRYAYPEAVANWGSGYVNLYKSTKEEEFLEKAKICAAWLKENKSLSSKEYSWGLPWEWEYWGAPKETSYVSTTGFVGDFLIHYYEVVQDDDMLSIIMSILKWLEDENLGSSDDKYVMFYYSPFPKLKFSIYNATAKAGALFAKFYSISGDEHSKDTAIGCARYLVKNQNEDGSWHYSEQNRNIDNYHTAFVLESMSEILRILPNQEELKESIERGLRYYLKNFYYLNGKGEELSISAHKGGRYPLFMKRIFGLLPSNPGSATLMSYGSGIRALARISHVLKTKDRSDKAAEFVIENLRRNDGAFNHKKNDNAVYIREQGHLFDGLCNALLKAK